MILFRFKNMCSQSPLVKKTNHSSAPNHETIDDVADDVKNLDDAKDAFSKLDSLRDDREDGDEAKEELIKIISEDDIKQVGNTVDEFVIVIFLKNHLSVSFIPFIDHSDKSFSNIYSSRGASYIADNFKNINSPFQEMENGMNYQPGMFFYAILLIVILFFLQ